MILIYLLTIPYTLTKFKSWDMEQLIDLTCQPETWFGGKLFQIDILGVLPPCHTVIKKIIIVTECIANKRTVKLVEIYWWNAGTISLAPTSNDQLNTDTGQILLVAATGAPYQPYSLGYCLLICQAPFIVNPDIGIMPGYNIWILGISFWSWPVIILFDTGKYIEDWKNVASMITVIDIATFYTTFSLIWEYENVTYFTWPSHYSQIDN